MTPATPPPALDLVTVLIALATVIFGPKVAAFVGPYAVIVLGAILGGAWSTSRSEPASRAGALLQMLLVVGLAVFVTVPAAEIAVRLAPASWGLEARWMFGPLAAVIGGVGKDWPEVIRWAIGLLKRSVEGKTGGGQQ